MTEPIAAVRRRVKARKSPQTGTNVNGIRMSWRSRSPSIRGVGPAPRLDHGAMLNGIALRALVWSCVDCPASEAGHSSWHMLRTNFGGDPDIGKTVLPAWFSDLALASALAAKMPRTSNPPHQGLHPLAFGLVRRRSTERISCSST
jgi:hypothetical protein